MLRLWRANASPGNRSISRNRRGQERNKQKARMNRRISQEENNPAVKTFLLTILTGIGLGIGFLLVNKASKKLEKKVG